MSAIAAVCCACFSFLALASAKCSPWSLDLSWKGVTSGELGVYKMCGDDVCGEPIRTLGVCTEILCGKGERCNDCSDSLVDVGTNLDDLPQFFEPIPQGAKVGRYGLQFDGETCPFLTIGSDFRVVRDCSQGRSWFFEQGWLAGCNPRVSCRARGGKKCRGGDPVFDVAVSAEAGYTQYYGLGNAVDLGECIAGGQGGGVPAGEELGVDCVDRGI